MRLALVEWRRDRFAVCPWSPDPAAEPLRAKLARGGIAGPFAIYPGTAYETARGRRRLAQHTLVHLLSQYPLLTLPGEAHCRGTAAELGACELAWKSAWPYGFTEGAGEELRGGFGDWASLVSSGSTAGWLRRIRPAGGRSGRSLVACGHADPLALLLAGSLLASTDWHGRVDTPAGGGWRVHGTPGRS